MKLRTIVNFNNCTDNSMVLVRDGGGGGRGYGGIDGEGKNKNIKMYSIISLFLLFPTLFHTSIWYHTSD